MFSLLLYRLGTLFTDLVGVAQHLSFTINIMSFHDGLDARPRSRSPTGHSPYKRSRSPISHRRHHHKSSPKRSKLPMPASLPFHASSLSKHAFEEYKPMFALYLDIQKHLVLEDLPEDEVMGRWKSFYGKWYERSLALIRHVQRTCIYVANQL